jgi:hypothetical protein
MKRKSSTKESKTTTDNLEERFDANEKVLDYFDTESATRRINLDIPGWAITFLDREAKRRGITRQSLIKSWLIDRIDSLETLKK